MLSRLIILPSLRLLSNSWRASTLSRTPTVSAPRRFNSADVLLQLRQTRVSVTRMRMRMVRRQRISLKASQVLLRLRSINLVELREMRPWLSALSSFGSFVSVYFELCYIYGLYRAPSGNIFT